MSLINYVLAVVLADPIFLWLLFCLALVCIGAVLIWLLGPTQTAKAKKFDGGVTKRTGTYKSQYISGGK